MSSFSRTPMESILIRTRNSLTVEGLLRDLEEDKEFVRLTGLDSRNRMLSREVGILLKENKSCKGLMLSGDKLNDFDVSQICQGLTENCALQILNLSVNEISSKGLLYICQVLEKNKCLMCIDLSKNSIGSRLEGLKGLGNLLKESPSLNKLTLDDNKINSRGIKLLAEGFMKNESLTALNLSDNNIRCSGAQIIASTILRNKLCPLIHLNLYSNGIKSMGGFAILDALRENQILLNCHLRYNQIDENIMEEIDICICRNRQSLETYQEAYRSILKHETKLPWQRGKLMVLGQDWRMKRRFIGNIMNLPETVVESAIVPSILEAGTELIDGNAKFFIAPDQTKFTVDIVTKAISSMNIHNDKSSYSLPRNVEIASENKTSVPLLAESLIADSFSWEKIQRLRSSEMIAFKIWDYSNEIIFSNLQRSFFTSNSVYLLLFSPAKIQDEIVFLHHCLTAVQNFCPSAYIILVCETKTESRSMVQNASALLKHLITDNFDSLNFIKNKQLDFFMNSMKRRQSPNQLLKQVLYDALNESIDLKLVPLRWVRCLDLILEQRMEPFLRVSSIEKLAKRADIINHSEIESLLQMFHELGFVIYFSDTISLADIIVTDPNWLTTSLSKLFVRGGFELVNRTEISAAGLENDFLQLQSTGLATQDILHYLWPRNEAQFLIELMRYSMLLSDWHFNADEKHFLIPALITEDFVHSVPDGYTCIVDFSRSPLYYHLFHRVICLFIAYSNSSGGCEEPIVSRSFCRVTIQNLPLYIKRKNESVISFVIESSFDCPLLLPIIGSLLRKVSEDYNLKEEILLECSGEFVAYNLAQKQGLSPWFDKTQACPESSENEYELDAFADDYYVA